MAAADQVFAWQGTDKSGRKTKGEITSSNAKVAKAELRKQGINAKTVKKKGGGFSLASFGQKVTPGDIALFTRQLATMMKAGVPLVSNQVEFSLLRRSPEFSGLLDTCNRLGVNLIAYSPLGIELK